jgi:TolB protein
MASNVLSVILSFCCLTAFSQSGPVGIFDHQQDIGYIKKAGSSTYDEATQTYTIKGSGANIWFNEDQFHYTYKKMAGNFLLTADFSFVGDTSGSVGHRKIGWMIRESADADAASVNATSHIDGLTVLQWRELRAAFMRDPKDEIFFPKRGLRTIQLERKEKKIIMRMANAGEPLQTVGEHNMPDMPDSVLAGLFICSHDSNTLAEAKVWNVRMDHPIDNAYQPNPQLVTPPSSDVLGSRLEILDVFDGKRKAIYESRERFEAARWMPDGKRLLYNEHGSSYTIPVEGGCPEKLETGTVYHINNDRSISFNSKDHVDGKERSPDGKYIYYNANPTGTMQIWRMKPDGSGREQITFDQYHNWFPHISPNGKWIVFISFPPDINPDEHPRYQRVMLRLMPAAGGAPRVIAFLYGGQGTLNARSWSPDSKRVVFVSNSGK